MPSRHALIYSSLHVVDNLADALDRLVRRAPRLTAQDQRAGRSGRSHAGSPNPSIVSISNFDSLNRNGVAEIASGAAPRDDAAAPRSTGA
jgi:hypothetical protein